MQRYCCQFSLSLKCSGMQWMQVLILFVYVAQSWLKARARMTFELGHGTLGSGPWTCDDPKGERWTGSSVRRFTWRSERRKTTRANSTHTWFLGCESAWHSKMANTATRMTNQENTLHDNHGNNRKHHPRITTITAKTKTQTTHTQNIIEPE